MPQSQLDRVFRLPGWRTYDFTDAIQRVNDVVSLVAEPCPAVRQELDRSVGWPLSHHVSLLKVRIYGRLTAPPGARSLGAFRIMPVVAFDPLRSEAVQELWHALIGDGLLSSAQLATAFGEGAIPKLRLVQYVLASRLGQIWFKRVAEGIDHSLTLAHELSGVLAIFAPPVAESILHLCESTSPLLTAAPHKNISASAPKDTIPSKVINAADPWHAQARLLEPFLWMFEHRERAARQAVKESRGKALWDPRMAPVLDRLRMGIALPDLRRRVADTGDGRSAEQAVSEFLDTSIDRGFVVPVTVECDGVVYRAYRHGEDVKDSEQLRRLAVRTLKAFADNAGISIVPKTWGEKLLVLLVKLMVDKHLVDPSDSMLGAYGTVGVRYDMHGPVLKREVPTLYSVHDQQAYTQLLCEAGYLDESAKGYAILREPDDVPRLLEGEVLAEKIGTSFGMLYHPRIGKRAGKPHLDLFDVVLLLSCGNARDAAGALAAELQLFQYHWAGLSRQIHTNIKDVTAAQRVLRAIRSSSLFTAINSGMAKFKGYQENASSTIIQRIAQAFRAEPASRILWRDLWSSGWDFDRNNTPPFLAELVASEGLTLLLINMLLRLQRMSRLSLRSS